MVAADPFLMDRYGNVIAMLVLSIGGTACVLAASQPPVAFWDKIHYVYGLLLPCMAFRLMFTCPMLRRRLNPSTSVDAFALPNPSSASLYDYMCVCPPFALHQRLAPAHPPLCCAVGPRPPVLCWH